MTVQQLRDTIKDLPGESVIALATEDSEGRTVLANLCGRQLTLYAIDMSKFAGSLSEPAHTAVRLWPN